MREWYILKYYIGKRFDEILVYANDKEEAKRLALIQLRQTRRGNGKIISVNKEGEEDEEEEEWEKILVFKIN